MKVIIKTCKNHPGKTLHLLFQINSSDKQYIFMRGHQSYAPFGSVSVRNKKQKKNKEQPGPGSYDVSLPFIMPIVQTIRKKNNNVIVKLGHMGTASFQSDEKRFKSEYLPTIGPGQYSPEQFVELKPKSLSQHRSIAVDKVRELIKKLPQRKPAISLVKEIQINEYVDMPNEYKRHQQVKPRERVKGSIWSKLTEARGQDLKVRSVSNIGPADYEPKTLKQKSDVPSAAFKSQSIRSFFDHIYFDTNQDKLAKQREQKKYKALGVGPGNYDLQHQKKQFHKFQFFGSTQERKLL